ncbi:hypothetical protein BX616_011038 [Lobosporangium transversale]|uniref:PHD-type domain-containing protein n=1 Tax=Lobosporangium transversale TaxID=64571 RepID=A0A1Y2GV85_9FUNG|nr:hypothetical protein BCR41DRAFT_369657 [Lobosporangium transversale]KAF9909844.1 hypothetical protein BX616_011038 [Lobosporangium transversale]ORZ19959.1 hypothetical protein BCR41DRAFT_369657 [Lobosporangium transversale]|eukprot:XP_021882499.1 hypothetical protein BCR41DRAFT_369657 [Lobosporangium transversale]
MSLDVAHLSPTKSSEPSTSIDIRRPKRQSSIGRKSRVQRDNIENALSPASATVSLANLPIQKQSTKIRKRLLTENQTALCSSDSLSIKRHKIIVEDRTHASAVTAVSATQNVTSLHRTLSDKSSYLNRASLADVGFDRKETLSKSQSTLTSWRKESQTKRNGSESEDADDEDDALSVNTTSCTDNTLISSEFPSSEVANNMNHSQATNPDLTLNLVNESLVQTSPIGSLSPPSNDDDPFGSDTTLTSPEEDSDDEHGSDCSSSPRTSQSSGNFFSAFSPQISSPEKSMMPTTIVTTAPIAPATVAITATTTVKRRGPGRPRKNPTPVSTSVCPTKARHTKPDEDVAASFAKLPDTTPATTPVMTPIATSPPKRTSFAKLWQNHPIPCSPCIKQDLPTIKMRGSLMARIIEGKKQSQALNDDTEFSDSSDDVDLAPLLTRLTKHRSELPRNAMVVEKAAATIDPALELALATVTKELALTTMLSPVKSEDHLFVVPTLHSPQIAGASDLTRSTPPKLPTHKTFTNTPRRTIAKQVHTRPSLRSVPRPQLFQTCLDIMTQSNPDRHRSNVQSIKVMLKHALERGMRKVKESADESELVSTKVAELDASSLQQQAWGCVIGNGKGLFQSSTRKQEEQQRMSERQTMVADAFRLLNLPPPPENWDKSSKVISAGLSLTSDTSSAFMDAASSHRLSTVKEDALDHMSRRLGCQYCRKTYKNRSGLVYHMERCTMAKLQTSMSRDLDGDSTASETEDQRNSRFSRPSEGKGSNKDINGERSNDDEYEDEEGIIMCVCGSKNDEGAMVQCDDCKVWLHIDCLDLAEEDIPEEYFCPSCQGLPIPSTGGKSFRHIPTKSPKRKAEQRRPGRPRRRCKSEEVLSDQERYVQNELRLGSESDSDDADSMDDDSGSTLRGLVSPQVVLSHDWEGDNRDPSSNLGYDSELMGSLFNGKPTRAIFRQSLAPALMLDGSSSQESQSDITAPLVSSDIGLDDGNSMLFQVVDGMELSAMGIQLGSETDMSFHNTPSFDYLPSSSGSFLELDLDETNPDHLLTSEDTLDSEKAVFERDDCLSLFTRVNGACICDLKYPNICACDKPATIDTQQGEDLFSDDICAR